MSMRIDETGGNHKSCGIYRIPCDRSLLLRPHKQNGITLNKHVRPNGRPATAIHDRPAVNPDVSNQRFR